MSIRSELVNALRRAVGYMEKHENDEHASMPDHESWSCDLCYARFVLAMATDPRVKAIRECPLVGSGTCSRVDETMSDRELTTALDDNRCIGVDVALKWARDKEEYSLNAALNTRWGENNDPELIAWNEWKEARAAL